VIDLLNLTYNYVLITSYLVLVFTTMLCAICEAIYAPVKDIIPVSQLRLQTLNPGENSFASQVLPKGTVVRVLLVFS
jgi:hypothetical protein